MRRTVTGLLALATTASLVMTACGSSSKKSNASGTTTASSGTTTASSGSGKGRRHPARHHVVDPLHAVRRPLLKAALRRSRHHARRPERRRRAPTKFAADRAEHDRRGRQGPDHRLDRRRLRCRVSRRPPTGRRQGHRLRPRQPRWHRAVLRLLRQRGRRQAAGADPGRLPQRQQGIDQPEDHR